MGVGLNRIPRTELIVADPELYEHSEQSRRATFHVEMFLVNGNAAIMDEARRIAAGENAAEEMARFVIRSIVGAKRDSPAWHMGCELSVADFRNGRIRWHELCQTVGDE